MRAFSVEGWAGAMWGGKACLHYHQIVLRAESEKYKPGSGRRSAQMVIVVVVKYHPARKRPRARQNIFGGYYS